MKKKLHKELSKLVKDKHVIIEDQVPSLVIEPSCGSIINYSLKFKAEKQKPEWIRITEKGTRSVPDGMLFKVKSWDSDGCPFIKDLDGDELSVNISKWELATPAEIEAHKLGFHVGDEVWVSIKEPVINPHFEIESFYYLSSNPELLAVYDKDGFWIDIKEITKTPPKTPIFQINGKDMFEGVEYFELNTSDNWVLKKQVATKESEYYANDKSFVQFLTKQEALEYVLKEAKRRFEGCGKMLVSGIETSISGFNIDKNEITDGIYYIWNEALGWNNNIKPIKEPKLMLGEWDVNIIPAGEMPELRIPYETSIICKGESVTKEEWLVWHNKFKKALDFGFDGFDLPLANRFSTGWERSSKEITIGCIGLNSFDKKPTLDQIEAITKALNEC